MKTYRTERLSDAKIVELLGSALQAPDCPQDVMSEFQRLVEMPASKLLQAVRDGLNRHRLGVTDAAGLIGVSRLTAQRWFESSSDLAKDAKHKLAGLCLLLSLASKDTGVSDSTDLVRSAVSALRQDSGQDAAAARSESVAILTSVFDTAGLTAEGLRSALAAARSD